MNIRWVSFQPFLLELLELQTIVLLGFLELFDLLFVLCQNLLHLHQNHQVLVFVGSSGIIRGSLGEHRRVEQTFDEFELLAGEVPIFVALCRFAVSDLMLGLHSIRNIYFGTIVPFCLTYIALFMVLLDFLPKLAPISLNFRHLGLCLLVLGLRWLASPVVLYLGLLVMSHIALFAETSLGTAPVLGGGHVRQILCVFQQGYFVLVGVLFGVEAVAFGEGVGLGVEIGMFGFETIEAVMRLGKEDERISFGVITGVVHLCFSCDLKINYLPYNSSAQIFLQLKMNNRMMLPIELTKILYQSWEGQISTSSQDSEIYGKCLNGPAKVTFKNGNTYEGNFFNGLLSGEGTFTWANGIVYKGEFNDNRITGKGHYKWPDGSSYEGEVKDGLRHGFGKYTIDEATYEGDWVQGKKEGKGKIVFKSGSIFEGYFKNDMKHGYGKMYYYPSGNYFEGEWRCDVKCGMGTMNWTDIREKYVGNWKNNQQEGWGIHIWLQSKGEGKFMRNRYEGNWKGGLRDGFGVFYYANGSRYEGYWANNMKEGYSFYTDENGKTSIIYFHKDRMIKGNKPDNLEAENVKKVPNKKEVEPNLYSLCLSINHFYQPFTPNLEQLYNYLLRNNTQLKTWYKNAAAFYEQQSEFSFCLNLEGIWKMIRSLKILGDFSLAQFNRGVPHSNPDIEGILKITPQAAQERSSYQDIYYRYLGTQVEADLQKVKSLQSVKLQIPFKEYAVNDRQGNILFRQFVHLLVWMAHHLEPTIDKPQKSIEKLITKIAPFLDSLNNVIKASGSENMSENRSSISKAQKNLSPFYKNINNQIFKCIVKGNEPQLLKRRDETIRLRELLGLGRINQCIGQPEWALLEKILEKYFDNDVLSRDKNQNWSNSAIPSKILNLINYELIQYEFIEIIYILFIKKLPSTKETEQNKKKYQDVVQDLFKAQKEHATQAAQRKQFTNEVRYINSDKAKVKEALREKRRVLEEKRAKAEAEAREKEREQLERETMNKEDFDIKDQELEEEPSEFEI